MNKIFCQKCNKELKENEKLCQSCGCPNRIYRVELSEIIEVRDSLSAKQKRSGFGLVKKIFLGFRQSGDKQLDKGVNVEMVVDREKDQFDHVVRDNKTGKIIHEEHERLTEHKSKK